MRKGSDYIKKSCLVLLLILVMILVGSFGCLLAIGNGYDLFGVDWDNSDITDAAKIPYIGFSKKGVSKQSEAKFIPAKEIEQYQSPYRKYGSTVHYEALSEDEKIIYKAMEYAFANKYRCIMVDNAICESGEVLNKVICYLSLDSPLVEQNVKTFFASFETTYPLEEEYFYVREVPFEGYYITINNFLEEHFDKRMQALEKAKEIVNDIDPDLTNLEKAEKLFRYLGRNTVYLEEQEYIGSYLYNALIEGEAICDGYANAISLLFNLAGINCFEKEYYASADEAGHTWNCFEIDGKWYNADCTATDYIPDGDYGYSAGLYFGFSDDLQEKPCEFASAEPKCDESLVIESAGHFNSLSDSEVVNTLVSSYRANNRKYTLITVEKFDEKMLDKQIQKMVNRLYGTVYFINVPCVKGYAVFVFNK